ncbi:hypothetical protein [Acidithiobacillus sp.]
MKNRITAKTLAIRGATVLGLSLLGTVAAFAASGGPFSAISNFINTNLLPAVASIGVAGGIGYGGIHAFKHDYGKAIVGLGTAAGGGFLISNSSWVVSQTGVSSATIGAHAPLLVTALHVFGL